MNATDAVLVGAVLFFLVVLLGVAVRNINRVARARPLNGRTTGAVSLGAVLLSSTSTGLALLAGISGTVSTIAAVLFAAAGLAWLIGSIWANNVARKGAPQE